MTLNQETPEIVYIDYNKTKYLKRELGSSIHIWSFLHKSTKVGSKELLDLVERTRASNFVFQKDRDRFIRDRVNLKKILSQYTGSYPLDVIVSYRLKGKPYLKNSEIKFNLSHSKDLSVYAISKTEIGVDIEKIREIPHFEGIMKRFFTEEEADQVNNMEELGRSEVFLKIWTQKEAIGKMLGFGLEYLGKDISKYSVETFTPHIQYIGALSLAFPHTHN
jgi:4'-phosphopantetheinyl transferase